MIAGITGLGTMFSMVPLSFADNLPANNETQTAASRIAGPDLGLTALQKGRISLEALSVSANSSLLQAYQSQSSQKEVAESLQALTKNLEGILHDTPYMSKLTAVQSGIDGVENTLKTPNLPNSDLQGATKTQGQLQDLVRQLQSIINDASAQYGT
ncbi:MAG: hypothetical protein J6P10_03150, partial [Aeriscardovia sp.]|nr:hypothetical protein [Aeriscardovia sp.]